MDFDLANATNTSACSKWQPNGEQLFQPPNCGKFRSMKPDTCLVLVNVPRQQWSYALTEKKQAIGRSPESSIEIPAYYRSVSRQHAIAWYEQGTVRICDVGSKCGTRVNGIWLKVDEPAAIIVGDRLTLGSAELRLVPATCKHESKARGAENADKTAIFRTPEPLTTRMRLQTLTHCEHNIVLWMARGYVQESDLSRILHRSPNTVRTQIASILKKLEIHSRMNILNELMKEGAALRIHNQVDGVI